MFKLIVGLGNFNVEYLNTRHNVGAWYIEALILQNNLSPLKKNVKFQGYTSVMTFRNSLVRLLIPNTYMNMSGISVLSVSKFYHFSMNEILIVHDELDLPTGKIKLKFSGSHNGHNGVKNIIENFENNNFYRLRIGIGRPEKKNLISNFVLSAPLLEEKEKIYKSIIQLVNCTESIIFKDFSKFMKCLYK